MSAYGTPLLCVLSAILGAGAAMAFGSHADTGQRVAHLQRAVDGNTERLDGVAHRLDGVAQQMSALRAAVNGTPAACPPAAADAGAAAAPPEHDAVAPPAPDDAPSAAEQELIAEAEQVLDRAARQRYWSERERDDFRRILPRLHGPIAQELHMRAMRGLNGDFHPRTHGPPL